MLKKNEFPYLVAAVLTGLVGMILGVLIGANTGNDGTGSCKIAAQNFGAAVFELSPNDPRAELIVEDFMRACEIRVPGE